MANRGTRHRAGVVALTFVTLLALMLLPGTAAAALKLQIKGIDGELRQNVAAYIGPRAETDRMSFRALARHADLQARDALQALGYYHPQIDITRNGNTCIVQINPGPPVLIRNVDIRLEGTPEKNSPPLELTAFIAKNAPVENDIFHQGKYETFKSNLLQQALMRGYFNAAWVTQEARVDLDANRADIVLALRIGERYRVGELGVTGTGIDTELIARFPRFHAGDWYDAAQIAELHRDLVRAGWFESVRIRAEPGDAQDQVVPVNIEYTMRKKNRVGIGLGASTDIGPRVQLQWEKPWLNSRGHSLNTYAEVSPVRSQIEASYLVPLTDPVTSQLAYTYGLQYEDLNDYRYWLTTAGIAHRQRLPNKWRMIRALELEQETDEFPTFQTRTTLLMPGVTFTRTEFTGAPLVTRGWRLTSEIKGAADALGSDADLLRGTLDGKTIHSFTDKTRVIARASMGALSTPDILGIPVSQRFFAGGDQSVRGYNYESIGPVNAAGERIGGSYLVTGSLEFDRRIAERWLVAAFVDQGSAFEDSPEFFTGTGVGVRWISLIGPLRLDFAWGVSLDKPSFNLHFYMGPEL